MALSNRIKLIVGLGNPGSRYARTRHNVGAWFVEALAQQHNYCLSKDNKFQGFFVKCNDYWLLKPTAFMNESGRSIAALTCFYKIKPSEILIAHDELNFPIGYIRLKEGGGHGGHNGLRNVIQCLGNSNFYRLRIGIDHPGHKALVTSYVLGAPSKNDQITIVTAIEKGLCLIPELTNGNFQTVMWKLHS